MQQLVKFRKFSSLFPWLKRVGLYFIAFAFFLSNCSCNSPKQNLLIDKEDREVVDDFLRYIAISQLGIYTILGSKPVSQFNLPEVQSEEELRASYEEMPKKFRKKVSFKRFNRTKQIEEFRDTCKKWMRVQHKYIGEHFSININEEMLSGYIVNIPLATYILREYYKEFSKVLGIDFDPAVASREIGKGSSNFWKVFENNGSAFLWGLLFGFGEKNSKLFQWEKEKSISFPFRAGSNNPPWLKKRRFYECAVGEKIENLDIPRFIVYQPIDEIVEKYFLEKERVIQIYKGKDFAETTVSYLKGEAVCQLRVRKKPL